MPVNYYVTNTVGAQIPFTSDPRNLLLSACDLEFLQYELRMRVVGDAVPPFLSIGSTGGSAYIRVAT